MPTRPCWVEIRTRALEENFRFLASLAAPHAELLAIVKANAYGHSLALCAPAVVRAGAQWLGVTSVEEGIVARALCPQARVLVIAGVFPGQAAAAIQFQLTPVAWEHWQLDELAAAARAAGAQPGSLPIHLEIDTGMSRQGVGPNDLAAIFPHFGPGSPLRLEGVMTHLFAADEADGQVTQSQLARLDEAMGRISAAGLFAEWLNVGNSAALLAGQARPIAELAARHGMKALLRPGLALYGLIPQFDPQFDAHAEPPSLAAARAALQPVLAWKAASHRRALGSRRRNRRLQRNLRGHRADAPGAGVPRATPTASTARSATASACWYAASAPRSWAASAWISRCWM